MCMCSLDPGERSLRPSVERVAMNDPIDMTTVAQSTGMPKRFFITRDKGEAARKQLAEKLGLIPDGEALLLVFPDAQLIDASFADECLVELQKELCKGTH